ncbi:MAG TPA: TonB-dependent receptor plug domain-containing protein [Longimicrobiales bacterium]|nr:TonB-dependent receptor plug domain-containing protein [Longimicrobiales bacterium]
MRGWAALAVLATGLPAARVDAQITPDSAQPADSVQILPDSVQILPDTAQILPDTAQVADSAQIAADTVSADTIFYNPPQLERGIPPGFATALWVWDHDDIMASGANTLVELLWEVPGVVTLLGGDYGTPAAISALGTGGGGVRIIRDGFEVYPLEGGVADLQRIGLVGVTRVRFQRSGGEMLIELTTFRYQDGRPFSMVEAGTGQLDTNLFRGLYADPRAFWGSIALGLERVDTRGYGDNEGGNRTGTWARYQLHWRERAAVAVDFRRMASETQVPDYAASAGRTDLTLRGRLELFEGVVLETYTGRSTYDVDDDRPPYEFEGGKRVQHGARLAAERGGLWMRGAYRLFRGDDLPSHRADASGGFTGGRFGVSGWLSQASWRGAQVVGYGGAGWLGPLAGVTLFGSVDAGTYASRTTPVLDELPVRPPPLLPPAPAPQTFATTERAATRVGASVTLLGTTLAAAALRVDNDVHIPLGIEPDRGSPLVPGQERYGVEAWASLPTPWRSMRLEGSYQRWDEEGPYLPEEVYQAGFVFHRTYLPTENFELWWSLGVRGHDPMLAFVADDGQGGPGGLARVPFFQSWYGRIQARILTVRLFFTWENFTIRRNLQSFPDRLLPVTRSFFGLRWDLWN